MSPESDAAGAPDPGDTPAVGPVPPEPIDGRAALRAALIAWMGEAAERGARELWWCDADLAQWPVGERAWIEQLDRWAGPGRRLIVLVADDAPLQRQHPRWAAWRRTWSHLVDLRVLPADLGGVAPFGWALCPGHCGVEVLDTSLGRARWVREPAALQRGLQHLRGLAERSRPGIPVNVLGL